MILYAGPGIPLYPNFIVLIETSKQNMLQLTNLLNFV